MYNIMIHGYGIIIYITDTHYISLYDTGFSIVKVSRDAERKAMKLGGDVNIIKPKSVPI